MSGPGFLQGLCTAPETHNSETNEDRTKYCDPNPNLGVIHGNGHRGHIHEGLTKYNASRKRSGRGEKGELSGFISDPSSAVIDPRRAEVQSRSGISKTIDLLWCWARVLDRRSWFGTRCSTGLLWRSSGMLGCCGPGVGMTGHSGQKTCRRTSAQTMPQARDNPSASPASNQSSSSLALRPAIRG